MEIAIFESVVIESALRDLEVEGEKYDGLYVDMDNAPERKYVKDKAAEISGLLKKIDRARIDASKNYKVEVEKQALAITNRLVDANSNFQVLIDDYNLERKKVLDAEKLRKQLILDAEQLELDHEIGLLINKTYEFDIAEAARLRVEEIKEIEATQSALAIDQQKRLAKAQEQDNINAENARLANKEHVQKVKTDIYNVLVQFGLSDGDAKTVIHLATIKELPNLTINY